MGEFTWGWERFLKCALWGCLAAPLLAQAQTVLNSGATLPIAVQMGQSFSQTFRGTGTIDNAYTLNGTLPPGLSLTTVTAPPPNAGNHDMVLSGVATAPGGYTFNVDIAAQNFSAAVNYSSTLVVTVSRPPALAVPWTSPLVLLLMALVTAGLGGWELRARRAAA